MANRAYSLFQKEGMHQDKTPSEKAIEIYKTLLADNPGDLESRWLLNIAYMTIGGYPGASAATISFKCQE